MWSRERDCCSATSSAISNEHWQHTSARTCRTLAPLVSCDVCVVAHVVECITSRSRLTVAIKKWCLCIA